MSYSCEQLRDLIRRVLRSEDGLWSPEAEELLLGTCAVESQFGRYLRQLGGGPARGAFQVEPGTFRWLQEKYSGRVPSLLGRSAAECEWDLRLSILIARLRYRVDPEPIPPADDVAGLAAYWKRIYNTVEGKGTEEAFVVAYRRYVRPEPIA